MLSVLHRDPSRLVVNKPAGLLTHPGWARGEPTAMSLARALAGTHVHPVHRLDRGASGALVFALDAATAGRLGRLFAEGGVRKRYLALVRGVVEPAEGVIDHPVPSGEERGAPRVPAVTAYRRLEVLGRFSLVECRPSTGRLHQIRRHLKHLGHPLVGDVNYGRGEINRLFRERYGFGRLALHAAGIAFEDLVIEAPLPEDLARVLRLLAV